ncbi:Carboxypeptidase S [Mycena venus]|uniref:Carboxypeptidase S n=1 Tax=Mycena venus TaxID=2733690 RepID=A0A8H7D2T8_9AGAR|nr:Carboxypeptidase S [Mycena venus]
MSSNLSAVVAGILALLIPYIFWGNSHSPFEVTSDGTFTSPCPQVHALLPKTHSELFAVLEEVYKTEEFKLGAYDKLSGAVGIPTESHDNMRPVGQDPRWDIFHQFHGFLESTFPLIYSSLRVTKVNTYGLVFHWQGSSSSLQPLLLTAHQDVVPVDPETVDQWIHPPYSGHYDGTWIWGRGSADDKSDMIAQLLTVDSLLRQGFKPRRTIVLAFGIDEESAGTEGAGKIAVYLEETYGRASFAMLLDEGDGYGENTRNGLIFASPGISEKGYFDAKIEVFSVGGHSSIPPRHTSIGILSKIVVALEDNLHTPFFPRSGTAFANVQCAIVHGPDSSPSLRRLAHRALTDDDALEELKNYLLEVDPIYEAMLRTTQAVDIVFGGVKANALPEVATAVVNHRISEQSSVKEVTNHIVQIVSPIAAQLNLSLIAFDLAPDQEAVPTNRIVLTDAFGSGLEPSPVAPIESGPYELLAGTIKAALETAGRYNSTGVIISPSLGLGNTDTQFYWNLTRHIFRYSHYGDRDDYYNGLHTVNEAVKGEALVEHVRFFTTLILNIDETKLFD